MPTFCEIVHVERDGIAHKNQMIKLYCMEKTVWVFIGAVVRQAALVTYSDTSVFFLFLSWGKKNLVLNNYCLSRTVFWFGVYQLLFSVFRH